MERTAAAIVTGAVGTDGYSGAGKFAAVVLGHAHGHLGADSHEHYQRQAANYDGRPDHDSIGQKKNLAAIWTSRGAAALTTWPNSALLMSPFTAVGPKKFV